jgi:hypothetical protein
VYWIEDIMSFFRKLADTRVRRNEDISAEDINKLKQQLNEKERLEEAIRLQDNQEIEEMKKKQRIQILEREAGNSCLKAEIRRMVYEDQEFKLQSEARKMVLREITERQDVELADKNRCTEQLEDEEKECKKQLQEIAAASAQIEPTKVNTNGVPSLDYRKGTMEAVCACAAMLLLWWLWYIWLKQ